MIDKIIKNKLRVIYDYKIEWYKLLNTLFRWLGQDDIIMRSNSTIN